MSKIITKTETHTNRNGDNCLVLVEINDFNEDKDRGGFNAIVTDKAAKYIDTEITPADGDTPAVFEPVLTVLSVLSKKATFYPYAQIDHLFTAIGDPILGNESFSQQLDLLQSRALLLVTQQSPIYGTKASDWEILKK